MSVLATVMPAGLAADELDDFARARTAYEAGDYPVAVQRFESLLAAGLRNPALIIESHKLVGVSALFAGDRPRAERHFLDLLNLAPEYELDPMVFPVAVVDVFLEVKRANRERLAALEQARLEEEARRRAVEEARRRAAEEAQRVYVGRDREKRLMLVALMPFGAGQFQNGDAVAGGLFLGSEVVLGVTAVTTYFLHESLRPRAAQPFASSRDRQDYENLEAGYRIANNASLAALGVVAVIGIIEATWRFEAERITWQPLDSRDVPTNVRPVPTAGAVSSWRLRPAGTGIQMTF